MFVKSPMLEAARTKIVLAWLRKHGCHCWKQKASAYMPAGISDIIGLTPSGKFFAIEMKTDVGKPTAAQLLFLEKVSENNGIAFVARNIEDVETVMEEFLPWVA